MRSLAFSRGMRMAAGAVACLALAAGLGVLAVDVGRWRGTVLAGDIRYAVAPQENDLWLPTTLGPLEAAEDLLGVEDDVAFREAIRALRLSRLEDPIVSDPELAIRRNEAQARLEAVVTSDPDDTRRSRAAGLLGVLGLSRFMYETEQREALLSATVANLQLAIDLDPENDDAKYNLELAFQRGRGLELTEGSAGANPSPGGSGSQGAGAGQPGSGY